MDPGAALLDAVYDAPDDDAPRLVYADWLQACGDPRGELIAMQLRVPRTPAQVARENELLQRHGSEWQGPLRDLTSWVEYERGFIARCALRHVPPHAVGLREWSTVGHLGIGNSWSRELGPLIVHPAMRSLTSLRVPAGALAPLLDAHGAPRVTHLIVEGALTVDAWRGLAAAPLFAEVASIDLVSSAFAPRAVLGAPLPPRLQNVVASLGGWVFECMRGDDGALSALAIRPSERGPGRPSVFTLVTFFEGMSPDALTALAIAGPGANDPALPQLRLAIGRQRRLARPPL